MTARGIQMQWAQGATPCGASALLTTTQRIDLPNESFTICGWHQAIGDRPGGNGNFLDVHVNATNTFSDFSMFMALIPSSFDGTAPLKIRSSYSDRTFSEYTFTDSPYEVDYGENYFWAFTWDYTTSTVTRYYGIDGGSLVSEASAGVLCPLNHPLDQINIGNNLDSNRAGYNQITNVKAWKSALNSTQINSEKHSASPVITANILAHYPLLTSSDLTNSQGSWPSLGVQGTINSGNMDPVDIQAAAAGGGVVFGGLSIRH